jgi:hypothetical protein
MDLLVKEKDGFQKNAFKSKNNVLFEYNNYIIYN